MTNDILITLLSLLIIYIVTYVSGKVFVNSKIKSFIPLGVEFADKLTENTNKEKLVKAISFIEISILSIVPLPIRPVVDYLIDSNEIANKIERFITKRKIKELNSTENKDK